MKGLSGEAAIVGHAEQPPQRKFDGEPRFTLEQWADLGPLEAARQSLRAPR